MMAYPELDDGEYTALRKKLLEEKGGPFQREFLEAARENASFVEWMEQRVGLEKATKTQPFDLWAERLSETEYKEPPKQVEKGLFDKWGALTPAQASQETFWGHVTLEHVKKGLIEASYLAANGGGLPGGLERIDKALSDGASPKEIDSAVRTALRRLSGLPEARGARSVYVNCPFARAWWRNYVARQVCEATEGKADFGKVIRTLTSSQEYWERLITLIVSRNSVLGDTRVRAALIWALSKLVDDKDKKQLFVVRSIRNISRRIGIRSAWQELGVFEVDELEQMMKQDFLGQVA